VPELGTLGSVRGALSNERPYRDLRNVVANYPFERSHRFAGIQPNLGHRDYSRAAAPGICRSAQCYHPAGVLAQTLVIDLCSLRRRAHCGNFCQSTLLFVDIPSRSSNVLSGLGKAIAFANHVKAEQVWGGCHPRMHHAGAPAPA
jgi:hypothetical protein